MVILHVLKSKIYSGAENVVCTIIKSAPSDVESIYLTAAGTVEDKLKELGVRYEAVDKLTSHAIKKAYKKYKPDLIHAHDFTASVLSSTLAKQVPVISHIHNNPLWIRHINLRTICYAYCVKKFVRVLTVSSSVGDEFVFKKNLQQKIQIVGNPFDVNQVREKGNLEAQNQSDSAHPSDFSSDLLFVGRLTAQKAPLDFIRIVAEVKKHNPNIKALMLGDGEMRGECERLIESLSLKDTIGMPGFCSNPYPYMNATGVLVMPSLWEGFGLVALEGMCFGKPVLARRVGGLKDIVNDDCGRVCESYEIQPLIDEAVRLLSDEEYYVKKSDAAYARADEYSNRGAYMEKIYSMYRNYIENTTVLHVLKSKIYSGAENVVCTIIEGMPKDVNSVYLTAAGPVEDKLKEFGITYRAVDKVTTRAIRECAHDYNANIIHAHDFTASVLSSRMAGSVPVISHIHNNPPWIKKINLRTIIYAISIKKFKKVLTVSSSVGEEFVFKKDIIQKEQVVGNPFDVESVIRKANNGTPAPASDLLFVGRLTEAKKPLDFIKVVAGIQKAFPNIRAVMVGEGELRPDCEKLIAELGLKDSITMTGFESNPYPHINATRLIVMPSLWEGFGLVALEGMCFGKPILATRVGGLKEIVTNECGFLCEPSDVSSLIAEATHLLSESAYYAKKSAAAKKRALSYDNCETYVKGILSLYRKL